MRKSPGALLAAFVAVALSSSVVFSQDATQAPAGGIVSLDDAPLTIVREHIAVSPTRVFADYTFRNDTQQTIDTTLAFIVPEYTLEFQLDEQGRQAFDDASFAIDGQPIVFDTEIRALLHGRDVTPILQQYRVDVPTFGHFEQSTSDLAQISSSQLAHLVAMGLYVRAAKIDQGPLPRWTVSKRYVHPQSFPPGVDVRVQLTYTPVPGAVNSIRYEADSPEHAAPAGSINVDAMVELRRVCASAGLQQRLQNYMATPPHNAGLVYVDYSFTGEHAWTTPIGDFSLKVITPEPVPGLTQIPSVCWSSSIPQANKTEWTAHAMNFRPAQNLRVGWVQLEHSEF
jgi:hypothetical protein